MADEDLQLSDRGAAVQAAVERVRAETALRESEQQLTRQLADVFHLQAVSSAMVDQDDDRAIYQQIVDAAISLMRSDAACVQMIDPETGDLELLGWKGFHADSAAHWQRIPAGSATSCGASLMHGERVVYPDLEASEFLRGSPSYRHYQLSGIVAMQSTPLVSRLGDVIGMLSTHWSRSHEPTEGELARFDILARLAADALESSRAQRAEARLRRLADSLKASHERLERAELIGGTGSFEHDLQTGETQISTGLIALLGLDGPPEPGDGARRLWSAAHPEDRARVRELMRQAVERLTNVQAECRAITPDGRVRIMALHAEPIVDDTGTPTRLLGVARDITDQRRTQDTLASTSAQLTAHADRLQRLALQSSAPGASAVPNLTDRQFEILHLIAQGFTTSSIAKQLYLSEPAVKWHVRQILAKTGAANRTEAVARILGAPRRAT